MAGTHRALAKDHSLRSHLPRPGPGELAPCGAHPRFPFAGFVAHRTETPLNLRLLRRLGIVAIGRVFTADVAVGGLGFY